MVARQSHTLVVAGSSPVPATKILKAECAVRVDIFGSRVTINMLYLFLIYPSIAIYRRDHENQNY